MKDTLIILFGGYLMPNKFWSYNPIKNKKTKFIKKLKQIGDVYEYMPTFYNIEYQNEEYKKYFSSDIKFDIDDISFHKCALEAYEKNKNYDNYIVIGTSLGIHFAIEFAKIAKDKCKLLVSIEGSHIGKYAKQKFQKELDLWNNTYSKYTKEQFETIKNDYEKIKEYISCKLTSQFDFNLKKIPVKSLHFQNLIINETMTEKDIAKNYLKAKTSKYLKKHNDDYNIVWMVNKTHTPFWTDINNIMKNINMYMMNKT